VQTMYWLVNKAHRAQIKGTFFLFEKKV